MNADIKAQWVAALRSGEYQQGKEVLTRVVDGKEYDCCLGVLCKVMEVPRTRTERGGIVRYENSTILGECGILPDTITGKVGLAQQNPLLPVPGDRERSPDDLGTSLSYLNDEGFTFPQIADLIEYFL